MLYAQGGGPLNFWSYFEHSTLKDIRKTNENYFLKIYNTGNIYF